MEARLIHSFQPKYNTVKFKNYPNIKGGMRSKGYGWTELEIEKLPAAVSTPYCTFAPLFDLEYEEV